MIVVLHYFLSLVVRVERGLQECAATEGSRLAAIRAFRLFLAISLVIVL
jgi:hypothetical protein